MLTLYTFLGKSHQKYLKPYPLISEEHKKTLAFFIYLINFQSIIIYKNKLFDQIKYLFFMLYIIIYMIIHL